MPETEQFGASKGTFEGSNDQPINSPEDVEKQLGGGKPEDKPQPDVAAKPQPETTPEPAPKKPEEGKPAAGEKAEDGKAKEDGSKERTPRQPSHMPTWQHKVAEDKWGKEKVALEARIAELERGGKPAPSQVTPEKPAEKPEVKPATPTTDASIEKMAEEMVAKNPEVDKEYVVDMLTRARNLSEAALSEMRGKMEAGLAPMQALQKEIEELRPLKERFQREELTAKAKHDFDADWEEEKLADHIRQEYGDITEKQLLEVKDLLFQKAHSEEHKLNSLVFIYNGDAEFRELFVEARATAEKSRGGSTNYGGKIVNFDSITPEQLAELPREQQDAYFRWVATKEA